MGVLRVEIDDESELAAQVRAVWDAEQAAARRYREWWSALPESEREAQPEPAEETFESCFERVFALGAGALLQRPPNCVLRLGPARTLTDAPICRGAILVMETVVLPVGSEVIVIETSRDDGPNWDVEFFYFGAMNLVSPHGSPGGVSLSTFRRVTRKDLLSAFDGVRTKVDLQVSATLRCKRDGAVFNGFRIYLHHDQQRDALGCRVELVECDHPEQQVYPLLYSEFSEVRWPVLQPVYRGLNFAPLMNPATHREVQRYRCRACGRLVVCDAEVAEAERELRETTSVTKDGG